jgi:molybdenum-dependent DNA-binding transcriptional regulator ModE
MTDLNSLIVFAHVVEANSFSGAARLLKMPISTVSRRIAELEDQLGMRLIERSTRRLRLTDAGSEVLEHARRIVELSDAVDNAASNLLSHVSGTLRLASPPSISDTLLAPIVGAFQEAPLHLPHQYVQASTASSIPCSPPNTSCWCSAAPSQTAMRALVSPGSPTASQKSSPNLKSSPRLHEKWAAIGQLWRSGTYAESRSESIGSNCVSGPSVIKPGGLNGSGVIPSNTPLALQQII